MVSHTEYNNITSLFGIGRWFLWLIIQLLAWAGNMMENMYSHVFSIFNIIYNDKIVSFFQGWIPFLWIPIAISFVVLGFSLITEGETTQSTRIKNLGRNFCLFMLIIIGLPYLFIGQGSSQDAAVFTDSSQGGYTSDGNIDSNSGLIDFFTNKNGKGIISGVSSLAGNDSGSNTYKTIVSNIYDLQYIYEQTAKKAEDGNITFDKNWSNYLSGRDGVHIYKNTFYDSEGKIKNASSVTSLDFNKILEYDDVDDTFSDEELKTNDVVVDGYDACYIINDDDKSYSYDNQVSKTSCPDATKESDIQVYQYLFKQKHSIYQIDLATDSDPDGDGATDFVLINNNGSTKGFWGITFLSDYPFRYYVEWGMIIVTLIISIMVLFLTSLKIVKIVYNIVVNHFLALIFGAFDLTNGQKIKEILKSIVSLVASAFVAVVLVELFYVLSDAVKDITFVGNNTANNWIRTIVCLFIGIATIKGPDTLERILGISGGLSDEWRDMQSLNRATKPLQRAAGAVAKAPIHAAGFAAKAGAGYGLYKYAQKRGAESVSKASDKLNQHGNPESGNANNFSADTSASKKNGRNNNYVATKDNPLSYGRDSGQPIGNIKERMATDAMTEQCAAFNQEVEELSDTKERSDYAKNKRGSIQNAALAEKAAAESSNSPISDKEALTRAYRASGFTEAEAQNLASRDINDGSFEDKKNSYDNSISALAQQKYSDNPLAYNNKYEAYQEAAKEHAQALGFNNDEAERISHDKAAQVYFGDNQNDIRDRANKIMKDFPDTSEEDAIRSAVSEHTVANNIHLPYDLSSEQIASDILADGSLKEGIKQGRVADNMYRERTQRNIDTENLSHNVRFGEGPISARTKAAGYMALGYMSMRGIEGVAESGYKTGIEKARKKRGNNKKHK